MPTIAIANTDISFECAPTDTIARAALRHGLGFPYECNVGSCGNCKFELLEGDVRLARSNPPGLTERDRQRNRSLGCQAHPLSDCAIKVSLRAGYVSRHRPEKVNGTLVAVADLTHDLREFRFELERGIPFLPGQYALLSVTGVEGQRAYSMSNVHAEAGRTWEFVIKRVPGGQASNRLFSLVAGDEIALDGPYGTAYYRQDQARDLLCLAGGSGIGPMLGIIKAFTRDSTVPARRAHLLYGSRGPADMLPDIVVATLCQDNDRFGFYRAISDEPPDLWDGHHGLLPHVAERLFSGRMQDFDIYFAGPPPMVEAVLRMAVANGVDPSRLHYDQFQ